MDDEHKSKLAKGRADARSVKKYLEFLENNKVRRGRRRTPESIAKRLDAIEAEMTDASPLKRLNLTQERMNLNAELKTMTEKTDGSELRKAFIEAAGRYAAAKGISASAFKESGVDAQTLAEAGIK